ncbi:MAG: hypothetical protein ACLTG0_12390 [Oscillibacter sp.]
MLKGRFGKSDRHGETGLSYALYGMTTGVYTLGEAVFEDSVWETSYEETFANTKSTPELWLSSALGTDMTGILYGTVTAARGIQLPLFGVGGDRPDREQLRLAVPQRERRRLEWHERCEAAPRKCSRLARYENGR